MINLQKIKLKTERTEFESILMVLKTIVLQVLGAKQNTTNALEYLLENIYIGSVVSDILTNK